MTVLALATRNHTVGLDINGADPIKGMQPDHLHLAWAWRPETGWQLWKVSLTGRRLKKDGTPGMQRTSLPLIRARLYGPVEYIPEAPAWAMVAAREHALELSS